MSTDVETMTLDAPKDYPECTRYQREERRSNNARTALYTLIKQRRRETRRDNDGQTQVYFDSHKPWLFFISIAALMLSTADAFFTITLLQHGSEELNPVMDYFIQKDAQLFLIVKFSITSAAIIFIVMHNNFIFFRFLKGYHFLMSCFLMYFALVAYELSMLVHII